MVPLLWTAVAATILCAGCRKNTGEFELAGTITVASRLQDKATRTNSALFVIAKNTGGVPVAVHRVVNPRFPVSFALGPEDLIVPGAKPEPPFLIQAQMNTHGNVGNPVPGDLEGHLRGPVHLGDQGIHIVIDTEVTAPAKG